MLFQSNKTITARGRWFELGKPRAISKTEASWNITQQLTPQ
jgi:hypothetical protein